MGLDELQILQGSGAGGARARVLVRSHAAKLLVRSGASIGTCTNRRRVRQVRIPAATAARTLLRVATCRNQPETIMNQTGTLRRGAMVAGLLLLAACATMQTGSDQYPRAELDGYSSYAWIGEDPLIRPQGEQMQISALTVRLIREAIEGELAAKGYRMVGVAADADFVVAFTVGARDRLSTESYPAPYRGPWSWGWEGRYLDVQTYREGTLSIDIFDGESRQPVWHGWARKTITSADTDDPGPVIKSAVARILREFPSRR
jgi:hypothetical protein